MNRSARFARTVSSMLLLVILTSPSRAQSIGGPIYTPGRLTPAQQVAREIYEQLIEINTSVTTGNITDAAVAMATIFVANLFRMRAEGYVPDRAIIINCVELAQVGRYDFPAQLSDVTRAFFTETALVETPPIARAMRALVARPTDAAALAIISAQPEYNTLLRTTCVATMLSGGHATNALPQLAEANVNCRIYPTETAESVRVALERVIADTTVQVLIRTQRPASPPATMSAEIMRAITEATKAVFGDIPVIPTMLGGATDSRFFRAIGVPANEHPVILRGPGVPVPAHQAAGLELRRSALMPESLHTGASALRARVDLTESETTPTAGACAPCRH